MGLTTPRYRQIRVAENTDDQQNSAAIQNALPDSATQEDLQVFFLSRMRQIIFGNDPGYHWYDPFDIQGIKSLKQLTLGGGVGSSLRKIGIDLVGVKDGFNRVFIVPPPDVFQHIVGGDDISLWHNGRRLKQGASPVQGDYVPFESAGVGTGYDSVRLFFSPVPTSTLVSDYSVPVTPSGDVPPIIVDGTCLSTDSPGDCVYIAGDFTGAPYVVTRADITDRTKMSAIGVILTKSSPTACRIIMQGIADGYSGLVRGYPVYVGVDGRPTSTPPVPGPGQRFYIQSMGLGTSPTSFLVRHVDALIVSVG